MNMMKEGGKLLDIYAYCPFCGALTKSADPDKTPQNAASYQGLHCLLTVFILTLGTNNKYHTASLKLEKCSSYR